MRTTMRGKPFTKGPDPRRNTEVKGPAPGAPNSGRRPDWWKQEMREGRDRYLIAAKVAGIVDNVDHPLWHTLGKFFHEAIDGKPTQAVDVQVTVGIADSIRAARARLAGADMQEIAPSDVTYITESAENHGETPEKLHIASSGREILHIEGDVTMDAPLLPTPATPPPAPSTHAAQPTPMDDA